MQSAAENEGGKEKGGKRHRVESPWRFFFLVALGAQMPRKKEKIKN
jgi:hypothetical protein